MYLEAGRSVLTEFSDENIYSFERVETVQFAPNEEYLQKCVEAAPVRRYLEKSRYRKPVYVITGLKTVHGAKAKTLVSRRYGGKLGVEVDGTVWSGGTAPVGGGPEVEGKTGKKHGASWAGSDDFVFAFRVRRVRVGQKTGAVDRQEDYKAGAMLGSDAERNPDLLPSLSILAEEDPDPDAEGYDKSNLMEGSAVVACAFPKTKDSEDEE